MKTHTHDPKAKSTCLHCDINDLIEMSGSDRPTEEVLCALLMVLVERLMKENGNPTEGMVWLVRNYPQAVVHMILK